MTSNSRRAKRGGWAVLGLVLVVLPALYMGAYLAAVARPIEIATESGSGVGVSEMKADYRFGGPISRWIFWPANQVDRRIRHDLWTPNSN
jgi:hypothetical protein